MSWNVNELLRKYLIFGSQNCRHDPEKVLEEAIKGGITAFQFREKGLRSLEGEEKAELGWKLRLLCRKHSIPFFINDDIDLADRLEVDGIHVGQDDMSAQELRKRFPDKIIGLSVSNDREVEQSPIKSVDYLGAGPMFPTATKEDVKPVVGVQWIQKLKSNYPDLPVVGIGGITTSNAYQVMEAGAQGVAVISAVTHAHNIIETVHKL
ncbi:thiamine phosphate synthase [Jeotgalibacillus sp. S-D1]|uniref:thiamine phosphate synthase n=1 Tax=Jeotgalibacillus sp. S-D1 TaxID=2552189 RepID=UPI001059C048|nr:thiamine phosphate synthase [Jeotgalibacillus sp. S-D1]TDL31834.1 thiamine phosphate synthase [Jeotgalibacillus sp. S-D1]